MTTTVQSRTVVLPTALVAAAEVLDGERSSDPTRIKRSWQEEAWAYYDESGPLRYATNWLANLISKARLHAATLSVGGDEPEPIDTGPVADAVAALAGGPDGQAQMLRSCAIELTVPGICYLVGQTQSDDEESTWRIYSQDVLRLRSPATPTSPAVYELLKGDRKWEPLPPNSLVVKVWRPHERIFWEADSPARAALTSLRELRRISQYIDAVLVSRLAGAGVLLLPQGTVYPTAPGQKDTNKHPFISEVMDVMMAAVKNPGTASQIVPIPIEVPPDLIDKIKHVSFATELSDKILAMRESALQQCAIALDVPAEVLTGMGEVNHWGSWQIEESAVKVFAEPLLELITAALTRGYLKPVLEAQGIDTENVVIWADTSELTAKPDRSDDAISLYDKGEASGVTARREAGLSDADKPSEEDQARWAYLQMMKHEAMIPAALQGLGIPIPEALQVTLEAAKKAAEAPPPPPIPGQAPDPESEEEVVDEEEGAAAREAPPRNDDPSFQVHLATVVALDAYVFRALERAGNRIRNSRAFGKATYEECPADRTHVCVGGIRGHQLSAPRLLDGAWDHVKEVAPQLGLDPTAVVRCLDAYCISLIDNGLDHSTELLMRDLTDQLWEAA
jgi:hypothetical protein